MIAREDHAEDQRSRVHLIHMDKDMSDVHEEVRAVAQRQSDQWGELRQPDDDGRGIDESHQYRMRQEIEQHPHACQTEDDLHCAGEERHQHNGRCKTVRYPQ